MTGVHSTESRILQRLVCLEKVRAEGHALMRQVLRPPDSAFLDRKESYRGFEDRRHQDDMWTLSPESS